MAWKGIYVKKVVAGVLVSVSAVALTACSNNSGKVTDAQASSAVSKAVAKALGTDDVPTCDSLLGKPDWAKVADDKGCKQGDSLQATASFDCKDGSKFFYFGENPAFYGNSKGALHKATVSSDNLNDDPGYAAAYKACFA